MHLSFPNSSEMRSPDAKLEDRLFPAQKFSLQRQDEPKSEFVLNNSLSAKYQAIELRFGETPRNRTSQNFNQARVRCSACPVVIPSSVDGYRSIHRKSLERTRRRNSPEFPTYLLSVLSDVPADSDSEERPRIPSKVENLVLTESSRDDTISSHQPLSPPLLSMDCTFCHRHLTYHESDWLSQFPKSPGTQNLAENIDFPASAKKFFSQPEVGERTNLQKHQEISVCLKHDSRKMKKTLLNSLHHDARRPLKNVKSMCLTEKPDTQTGMAPYHTTNSTRLTCNSSSRTTAPAPMNFSPYKSPFTKQLLTKNRGARVPAEQSINTNHAVLGSPADLKIMTGKSLPRKGGSDRISFSSVRGMNSGSQPCYLFDLYLKTSYGSTNHKENLSPEKEEKLSAYNKLITERATDEKDLVMAPLSLKTVLTEQQMGYLADSSLIDQVSPASDIEITATATCCGFKRWFPVKKLSEDDKTILAELSRYASTPYDSTNEKHEKLLREYWHAGNPDTEFDQRPHVGWQRLGFQGKDPRTDFRGGGILSLTCMVYFARERREDFNRINFESIALANYPFSAGFINVAFLLIVTLRLASSDCHPNFSKRNAVSRKGLSAVCVLLRRKETHAFEELFCCCCIALHEVWKQIFRSQQGVTLMDFPAALRIIKSRLCYLLNRKPESVKDFERIYDIQDKLKSQVDSRLLKILRKTVT